MLSPNLRTYPSVTAKMQRLRQQWHDCERCPLHLHRSRVVHARGTVPCDVLLIGEAPGDSEDSVGVPFAPNAPAGELLDTLLTRFEEDNNLAAHLGHLVYACTNIVACIPKDGPGEHFRAPKPPEAKSCKPRLMSFIQDIAKPSLIIALGRIPEKYCKEFIGTSINWHSIPHPSWILRQPEVKQALEEKRCIIHPSCCLGERVGGFLSYCFRRGNVVLLGDVPDLFVNCIFQGEGRGTLSLSDSY